MNIPSNNPDANLSVDAIREKIGKIFNLYSARRKKTYKEYKTWPKEHQELMKLLTKQSGYNVRQASIYKQTIQDLFNETKNQTSKQKKSFEEIVAERKEILFNVIEKKIDQLPPYYKSNHKLLLNLYNTYQLIRDKDKSFDEIKTRKEQFIGEELLKEYLESNDFVNYIRSNQGSSGEQHISEAIGFWINNKTKNGVQLKIVFDALSEQKKPGSKN